MNPPPPAEVTAAAADLRYRDYMIVALAMPDELVDFDDNWLYIHTPDVHVARIQNYKNWSAAMIPDAGVTCLGLEYFCNEGDALWSLSDSSLLELARRELQALGLAEAAEILSPDVILPAPGQGAIAIEARAGAFERWKLRVGDKVEVEQ
jgi:protoporphyrinogen oxidase